MARVYNFSAGPSMLPQWVLEQAATQMMEYGSTGQSVMEMSHRSCEYQQIIQRCEELFRQIMEIPDNYKVLFLQGGGSLQFAMIPMNLMTISHKADVIHTGVWTKKAIEEMNKQGQVKVIASGEAEGFRSLPALSQLAVTPDADFVYMCANNTIYGTELKELPDTGEVPLVCDMSSCILSHPVDVSRYGLIFAGAQKNIGIAGLTVVIIREDLLQRCPSELPAVLNYQTHVKSGSLYHTPPTYSIYICMLMLEWLQREIGSLEGMAKRNSLKGEMLYSFLDRSKLFSPMIPKAEDRSLMNVTFTTGSEETDKQFLEIAKGYGLINLKGHRVLGGLRASLYNAMPLAGVEQLVEVLAAFEKYGGKTPGDFQPKATDFPLLYTGEESYLAR